MTAATFENIAPLPTPGEQCLYHADLIPGRNVTIMTDIALKNPTEEDVEFPPTATAFAGSSIVISSHPLLFLSSYLKQHIINTD
jgi:hypothetical protein